MFSHFVHTDLIEHFIYETKIYSVQVDSNTNFKINSYDLKKYLKVYLLMSLIDSSNNRQ